MPTIIVSRNSPLAIVMFEHHMRSPIACSRGLTAYVTSEYFPYRRSQNRQETTRSSKRWRGNSPDNLLDSHTQPQELAVVTRQRIELETHRQAPG
jgi:hypothetical protein